MYIVMPYAAAGSLEKRVKMYAESLDSTIKVGVQLAKALAHAHAATPAVIHRDVKPANILFREDDQIALLADFGICLIADRPRVTEEGEVVGPWAFMAPESQEGGQLEVTAAADLYSLGKVIYFMISGGVLVPRESHRQSRYDLHNKGGGFELLWLLLDQLICPLDRRIVSAIEVIKRLEAIEHWGRRPAVLVSDAAKASLDRIAEADLRRHSVQEENRNIRERRATEFRAFAESLMRWMTEQIQLQADNLHRPGVVETGYSSETPPKKLPEDWNQLFGRRHFEPVSSVDLKVCRPKSLQAGGEHWLTFILAIEHGGLLVGAGDQIPRVPDEPIKAHLLPMYFRGKKWAGFLSRPQTAQPVRPQLRGRKGVTYAQAERVRRGFYGESMTFCLGVDVQRWPEDIERYEKLIAESLEVFLAYIESGASVLG